MYARALNFLYRPSYMIPITLHSEAVQALRIISSSRHISCSGILQDMTYTKQLEQYEQRVMQKRLEEMPETERERLMDEVDKERERRGVKS